MDSRLYHYEYRRPRLSNPTYSSYNVNTSMTYFMKEPQTPSRAQQPLPNMQISRHEPHDYRERTRSQLSNYGNSSLAFNERQIYNKQNSKFNIISLKPKQFNDQIKVYPKLSQEDKDMYYLRKMEKLKDQEIVNQSMRRSSLSKMSHQVAGKHLFNPDQSKMQSHYQHGRYFTPAMLNHADQVGHIM